MPRPSTRSTAFASPARSGSTTCEADGEAFRDQWRRFWAAANLLQFLPEFLPLSRRGIEERVYAAIVEDAEAMAPSDPLAAAATTAATVTTTGEGALDGAWHHALEETFEPEALARLAALGAPPPDDIGEDHKPGDAVVANLEWRWNERRVALVAQDERDDAVARLADDGWRAVATTDEAALARLHGWLTGTERGA